jgi:undecaprenyl-diphosphatase
MLSWLLSLNYMAFKEINAPAGGHPLLDAFMVFCANSLIFFFPLVLLLLWGRPLAWRKQPMAVEEMQTLRERRAVVLWTGVACVLSYGLSLLIEQFVFEPRPFVSHKVHLLVSHAADGSFPSDHSAWAFAVVGMILLQLAITFFSARHEQRESVLWHVLTRKFLLVVSPILLLALVFAVCIGVARVFVGVHYPGDILGGAIDGLFAASVVTWVRHPLNGLTQAVLRFATFLHLA